MSRFYADIQGNRGRATRQGTAKSGITGHIRGWSIGAKVYCDVNANGEDEITVHLTGGSHHPATYKCLGMFTEKDL